MLQGFPLFQFVHKTKENARGWIIERTIEEKIFMKITIKNALISDAKVITRINSDAYNDLVSIGGR